jgi:carbonic anhydrase
MNPKDALQELLSGNVRYVEGRSNAVNTPANRLELAQGQSPIAAVIRCADSRVAPEIVFDQPLGKLFVCAVAGNIPTPEIVESIEYTVGHLGTRLIVVMGHSSCGAVTAALQNEVVDGLFAQVALSPIPDLNECISHNAEQGIATILGRSPMIEEAVKSGDVQIVAGVQDIATGEFELVAQTQLN